jgi:hypothetical protein
MNTSGRIVVEGTRAVFESEYKEEVPSSKYDSQALRRIAAALERFADQIDHINVALSPKAPFSVANSDDVPF